jgi:hypothetical protein
LIAQKIGWRVVHGFDSFQGLLEDWGGYNFGQPAFDVGRRMLKVPNNVRLLDANPSLRNLADRIVPGAIILFDEYSTILIGAGGQR